MRQLGRLGSFIAVVSVAIACGSADPSPRAEPAPAGAIDHEARAKQIVTWLDAGEHAKVRELFDEAMTAALASDIAIAATWSAIEAQFGQLDRQIGTSVSTQAPYTIVLVTCQFASAPMDVRVVFDQAGRLAGLQITPTQNPEAYGERPQTPKPPFPYTERPVSYPNPIGGIQIGGTLTIPAGAGRHPAVVLITGSGSQDRDETLFGHKPFLVIADHLTRRGIAVLRLDDRGVGQTTGDPTTATVEDHVTDVEAGLAFLTTQPEIDPHRIGLIGHSEGGVIAAVVAAKSSGPAGPRPNSAGPSSADVAFVVSLAGPAVSGAELNPMQVRALLTASNAPAPIVDEIVFGQQALMKLLVANAPEQDLRDAIKQLAIVAVELTPGAKPDDLAAQKTAAQELVPLLSPWFRSWAKLDPALHLAKIDVPILILIGDKDLQVPAAANLERARVALAGNPNARFEQLPGLNLLFQTATTGMIEEYATIPETFSPVALDRMTEWLLTVNGL